MKTSGLQIGRRFETFTFVVDQSKVDELCFALREQNPIFRRSERTPVPPTFLNSSIQTLITGRNSVDELGISRRRALHAGQEYEYIDSIYVGDTLQGTTTLVDVADKEGRSGTIRFLTLETRFSRAGKEVAVVRNRVAVRLGDGGGNQ